MAKHKTNSVLRQAQLEAKVQYGPEKSALSDLLKQARSDLKTSVKGAEGAASGIMAAADAAKPEITRAYQDAGRSLSQANRDLGSDLNALSSAADPYKAVSRREFTGAQNRLAEAMAGALNELQGRKVGAQDARAFGVRQALGTYQKSVGQVNTRQKQIAGEQGALTSATYEKLVSAQQQEDQRQRNSDRQFSLQTASLAETARGHDLSAAGAAAGRALSAKNAAKNRAVTRRGQDLSSGRNGKKPLSPSEQRARQTKSSSTLQAIQTAAGLLRDPKGPKDPTQRRQMLLSGANPAKTKFPTNVVNSAFDLHAFGRLSLPNFARLSRDYVKVPAQWHPLAGRQATRTNPLGAVRNAIGL